MTMNIMLMPSPSGRTRMQFKWLLVANYRIEQNG